MSVDAICGRPRPGILVAVGAMVLSTASWGLGTVMTKSALAIFSPLLLLNLQLLASVAFLWAAVVATGQRVTLDKDTWRAASSGVLEPGLAYAFGTFGLMLTSAGNASLIATTEPLLIAILAWLMFRERIRARTAIAILAAMVGIGLVTAADGAGNAGRWIGDALIVLGTLFAALYVVWSSRLVADFAPVSLAALQQSAGLALAAPLLLVMSLWNGAGSELGRADPGDLVLALVSGVVQYALAFWFYLIGLRRLPASTAALFLTLTPVFGLGGAVVFLGEDVGALQAIGALIIVAAVGSAARASSDRAS